MMPLIAPVTGGLLLTFFHWRAGFVFQFTIAALAAFLVWRYLPETQARVAPTFADTVAGYRMIASNPVFLANLAVGAVGYSGLFAWISGSSFVLQVLLQLTPLEYSVCYALSCVGFMIGGAIASKVVMRLGLDRTAGWGAVFLTLSGMAMVASVFGGVLLPVTLTLSMDLYLCGLGLLLPQTVAAALNPFPKHAASAASLIGFVQQCAGALMGFVVGHTLGATAWPIAIGIAVAGGGSLALWVLTRQQRLQIARKR
jgi:DHA1 family bicyclomycin/chloramphenicol resistance-like MFS transporter